MKQIISFLICSFTILVVNAQTISPLQSNEFCPGTEYTFTVTIPKTYSSMIGEGGCFVTQSPTFPVGSTFTFKGKFGDANQKQTFRIYYTDGSNDPFEFKKNQIIILFNNRLFTNTTKPGNNYCTTLPDFKLQY